MKNLNNQIVVSIQCLAYNHAPYIRQCLDGFVMQKTNFRFEAIIHDDASTDGTQDIIREYEQKYPDIIKPIYETENQYSKGIPGYITDLISSKCKGKYIALCEGDDYWTDPLKLQKQVDFLEEHEDFSCCCHRFKIYFEDTNTWTDDYVGEAFDHNPHAVGLEFTNSDDFRMRFTQTLTMCYRRLSADNIVWPPYIYGKRDFNLHYHLLKEGKGWCFADYMGVYRKHEDGVWSGVSKIEGAKTRLNCFKDLYRYNHTDKVILERYSEWLDKFAGGYVFPPLYQRRFTKEGLKNLCIYFNHCWTIKSFLRPFLRCVKCMAIILGIIKV